MICDIMTTGGPRLGHHMHMRALVLNKELSFHADYPIPAPKTGEALIRVTHAGICNTDLELVKGYMGFRGVPGHEFVGRVERSPVKKMLGQRVVGEINIPCGTCSFCRRKMGNHCADRTVLGIFNKDGAFAEYLTLPLQNLHVIPDSVSDEEAVFVEPLAAAFEILKQVDIKPSDRVCVLGDGKLGLLVAQVLSFRSRKLVAAGNHPENLSILEEIGISTREGESLQERAYDLVVDCTGARTGIDTALKLVRPGGRIVMKTTVAKKASIDLNRLVVNEVALIGSRCGPFDDAIRAIKRKEVELCTLISCTFSIDEGVHAFRHASRRGVLKVIIQMD